MDLQNSLKDINETCKEILRDQSQKAEIFKKTFAKCTNDRQRIKLLMWSYYKDARLEFESPTYKNKKKSIELREEGNANYKKKKFGEAIASYNRSLAFAPVGRNAGQEAALAYANRSAVLFHIKKYTASLQDIQRSLQIGYPATDRYKLIERRAKCFSKLGKTEEARLAFIEGRQSVEFSKLEGKEKKAWLKRLDAESAKLNAGSNETMTDENDEYSLKEKEVKDVFEQIPFGWKSDCVKIEIDEQKGRYMVATRDIKVGEIIIYEKTPACVLAESFYTQFCYHCFRLLLNPLPCPVCSKIFFCSDVCRDSGLKRYHLEECMSLDQFKTNTDTNGQLPTIPHVAFRCLLAMSPGDFDKVDMLGSSETSEVSVATLVSHNNERDLQQLLMFSLVALQGAITLHGSPYWSKIRRKRQEGDDDLIIHIAAFLLHFIGASTCNSFQVSCYEFNKEKDFRQTDLKYIGVCICPFIDMSNHSCNPSADVEFYKTNCVVTATAPVKAGEEVNVDYGPHYSESPKNVRQNELLSKFFFTCKCESCENNWPTVEFIEEQTARFRCEVCRAEITLPVAEDGTLSCSSCPHKQNMHTICEVLAESHAAYKHVMEKTKQAGVETLIAVLEQHITLLDYWVCLPWKDYAKCQATLKQVYRCLGNHFNIEDKLW